MALPTTIPLALLIYSVCIHLFQHGCESPIQNNTIILTPLPLEIIQLYWDRHYEGDLEKCIIKLYVINICINKSI